VYTFVLADPVYRLQESCKFTRKMLREWIFTKFEFSFTHFWSCGHRNVLVFHRRLLILNKFTFGKGESLTFMTFHDTHARTHARMHGTYNIYCMVLIRYDVRVDHNTYCCISVLLHFFSFSSCNVWLDN
jgi:hypothetical protein